MFQGESFRASVRTAKGYRIATSQGVIVCACPALAIEFARLHLLHLPFRASEGVALAFLSTTDRVICGAAILVMAEEIGSIMLVCVARRTVKALALALLHTTCRHIFHGASFIVAKCRCSFMSMGKVIRASIGVAIGFVITADRPVGIVAREAVAWNSLRPMLANVTAATFEGAACIIRGAAMLVVCVVALLILTEQRLSVVLWEEAFGAWECLATAFLRTASACVFLRALAARAKDVGSSVHEHLARWAKFCLACRLTFTTRVLVMVTACPMCAMRRRRVLDMNKAAWASVGTTLAFLSAALFEVCVVTAWVCAHNRLSIGPVGVIIWTLETRAITILCTTCSCVRATAGCVFAPLELVVGCEAIGMRTLVRGACGNLDTADTAINICASPASAI